MTWYELQFLVPEKHIEQISDILFESNAASVTMSEGPKSTEIFGEPNTSENKLWQNTIVKALVASRIEALDLKEKIQQENILSFDFYISALEEKDWKNSWKEHHQPIKINENLWICPSWHTLPNPDATNVIIDPQQAFGTGSHETTQLCLSWLEKIDLCNKKILDYGCGSGILAIAAAKLGAQAYAWDIDKKALETTEKNALLNDTKVELSASGRQFDLIVANILLEPLQTLHSKLVAMLKPNGRIALSGILLQQANTLKLTYDDIYWDEKIENKDWVLISGVRNSFSTITCQHGNSPCLTKQKNVSHGNGS